MCATQILVNYLANKPDVMWPVSHPSILYATWISFSLYFGIFKYSGQSSFSLRLYPLHHCNEWLWACVPSPDDTNIYIKVKVELSLCFFNWAPCHEGVLRDLRYSFTLSWPWTRCSWVVSLTLRPLKPMKEPLVPVTEEAGGPQSRYGRGSEEKYSQPRRWFKPPVIQLVAQCYTTELTRLFVHNKPKCKVSIESKINTDFFAVL
jgi:hypothetical protein